MTITVRGPGGVVVNFPDGTPAAEIERVMQGQGGSPAPDPMAQPPAPALDNGGLEIPTAEGWLTDPARMQQLQAALRQQHGFPEPPPLEDPNAPENEGRFLPATGPGQFARSALQGLTFGWSDELAGLLGGDAEFERQRLAQHRAADPSGAAGAELIGGLPTALLPAGWASRGVSTGAQVARGALGGAAAGATYGAGTAEPGQRIEGALRAAGPTALMGAALPAVAPEIARILLPGRATTGAVQAAAVPTTAELRAAAQSAYQTAEQYGLAVSAGAYDDAILRLSQDVQQAGFDPQLHPRANAALTRLASEANGQPLTLQQIDILRRVVNGAARSLEPDEQRIAGIIRDHLDDFLDNLQPNQVAVANWWDADDAVASLNEARGIWAQMRKAETIEELAYRAENAVGANFTQAGYETAIRQQYRRLANNEREMARFTPEEQELILQIVRGDGGWQTALRRLGAFAPRGAISAGFGIVGAATGNPLMIGASALGEGARRLSTGITNRNVEALDAMVRSGSAGAASTPSPNAATALMLLQQANMLGMPRAAGQYPIPFGAPQLAAP